MVTPTWVSGVREAEQRAGIEPLDEILNDRQQIVEAHADLWALYGPGGLADNVLSAEKARLVAIVRAQDEGAGVKVVEGSLEPRAKVHPAYLALVTKQVTERAEYFRQQEHLQALEWRYHRANALLKAYASEPK